MKKALAVALMIGLIAAMAAIPAEAGRKKKKKPPPPPPVTRIERVVELAYEHPGIGVLVAGAGGGYPVNFPEGSSEIGVGPDDKFFKIEVIDASGQKVAGSISQGDIDGNGINDDLYGTFCGAHPEPQPLAAPGSPIVGIYAFNGVCEDGSPSVMTSGTIKVTFSNMP